MTEQLWGEFLKKKFNIQTFWAKIDWMQKQKKPKWEKERKERTKMQKKEWNERKGKEWKKNNQNRHLLFAKTNKSEGQANIPLLVSCVLSLMQTRSQVM